jgi:hypothetical protein
MPVPVSEVTALFFMLLILFILHIYNSLSYAYVVGISTRLQP